MKTFPQGNCFPFLILLVFLLSISGCAGRQSNEKKNIEPVIQKNVIPEVKAEPQPKKHREDQMVIELVRDDGIKRKRVIPVETVPPETLKLLAKRQKKVFEFVQIGDEQYTVPHPWRGQKIEEKSPGRNELRQIPSEFSWNGSTLFIHKDACEAFIVMAEKAKEEGVELVAHSGFRSVWYQRKIISSQMSQGRTWQDLVRYVAPPGYSEHATGMVVDLYPSDWRFAGTDEYGWLQKHGVDFGFRESYPRSSPQGFPWEAWHWRYVGENVNTTLESTGSGMSESPSSFQAANDDVAAQQKK